MHDGVEADYCKKQREELGLPWHWSKTISLIWWFIKYVSSLKSFRWNSYKIWLTTIFGRNVIGNIIVVTLPLNWQFSHCHMYFYSSNSSSFTILGLPIRFWSHLSGTSVTSKTVGLHPLIHFEILYSTLQFHKKNWQRQFRPYDYVVPEYFFDQPS